MTWDEIIKVIMTALDAGAMADHDDPKMRAAYPHIYGPLREKASAIISALEQSGFRIVEDDRGDFDGISPETAALIKEAGA